MRPGGLTCRLVALELLMAEGGSGKIECRRDIVGLFVFEDLIQHDREAIDAIRRLPRAVVKGGNAKKAR